MLTRLLALSVLLVVMLAGCAASPAADAPRSSPDQPTGDSGAKGGY
jgi:hypothetical protein